MGSHESRCAEVPALSALDVKSDGPSKMKHNPLYAATLLSALGCGLIGGVFFSFSSFVMKALAKLPPTQGIAAMQSINVVVINRWFMSVFFGTAIICLVLAILSVFRWQTPGAGYRLIGSLLYLLGTILVTIVCNVPVNDSLAAVDPASTDAGQVWANYLTTWTAWNHARTIAALAAAAAFTAACCRAA
jgi:uncharacterized membrane protein